MQAYRLRMYMGLPGSKQENGITETNTAAKQKQVH